MSPTLSTRNIPATPAGLKEIASQPGPCVTLLIPPRHAGAREASRAVLVKKLVKSAAEQVGAQKLDSTGILLPIENFAAGLQGDESAPAIALFSAPGFFAVMPIGGAAPNNEGSVTVGRHFHLASLVTSISAPQEFYVLALSRKNLHLYRYTSGRCEPVELPANVPSNMEVGLGLDKPEHRTENRSPSGSFTGSMKAVQFGTSSEKEAAGERLHHFFQLVDRGLKDFLKETPLVLAGVHEEIAAYRRAAHHALPFPDIQGNIDFLSPAEIAQRASEAALTHYRQLGEAVLEKYREMPDRQKTSSTALAALDAALAGRVHQLCAAEGTAVSGSLNGAEEDLVNAAIIETLRSGGEVFMLPSASMPEGVPVAAILRF